MNCRHVEGLLGDHQDGVLAVAERRAVEDHLAECPSCAVRKDEMDLALDFLRKAPAVEIPKGLVSHILDETVRLEPPAGGLGIAGTGPMGWLRPLLRPLFEPRLAMSMAMVLVSFSILTWSGQRTFDRWRDADPMARVMTATAGLDQAWERGIEIYRQAFAAEPAAPANKPVGAGDAADISPAREQ